MEIEVLIYIIVIFSAFRRLVIVVRYKVVAISKCGFLYLNYDKKFSFFVELGIFIVFISCLWLVTIVLDSINIEFFIIV